MVVERHRDDSRPKAPIASTACPRCGKPSRNTCPPCLRDAAWERRMRRKGTPMLIVYGSIIQPPAWVPDAVTSPDAARRGNPGRAKSDAVKEKISAGMKPAHARRRAWHMRQEQDPEFTEAELSEFEAEKIGSDSAI